MLPNHYRSTNSRHATERALRSLRNSSRLALRFSFGEARPAASSRSPVPSGNKPNGWAFSGLVSSVFDAVRWPPDPWEVIIPTDAVGLTSLVIPKQLFSARSQLFAIARSH